MQIYQLIARPQKKDAIGRMSLALHEALSESHQARFFEEKKVRNNEAVWLDFGMPDVSFFQHSTGSVLADKMLDWPSKKKVFIFQNITPIDLLDSDADKKTAEWGFRQLDRLIHETDVCIGTSKFNCDTLREFGAKNPVQIPYLLPKRFSIFSRKKTSLVLMVSRVEPYKGMLEGIEAFVLAKKQSKNLKMMIIGNTRANPKYVEQLNQTIEKNNLERDVKIVGRISDFWMDYYYSRAFCLLSLSEHEGFGVPVVEAHRWQVPVIALNRGAISETLGQGGILLGDRSAESVAQAIGKLNDSVFYAKLQNLQKRESQRFSGLEKAWVSTLTKY